MQTVLLDRRGEPYSGMAVDGWRAIGESIRRARQRLAWSQAQLARASGMHQSTISRLETGQLTGLRWARFGAIVGALGQAWPPSGNWAGLGFPGWDRLR